MNKKVFTFAVVGFFVWGSFAQAQMSSTNFKIRWDSVSTGGSDTSSSASYLLRDTTEAAVAGSSTSASYRLDQGYRSGVDEQIISFDVFVQDLSLGRSATALAGTTVSTDTTSLSVNDYVGLIQDVGSGQVSMIGKIQSIGSGTVTVDVWKHGGTLAVIDGANDLLYPLTSSAISFGQLSSSSLKTALIAFEVTAANDNGYVVQVYEDGNLRSGSSEISDVVDGSVTVGSPEYGARSSDTSLSDSAFDTSDAAVTSAFQTIASESTASFASRNFLTLKTAVDSIASSGSYAHTISFIASGNF
jgi:hypothetical protein